MEVKSGYNLVQFAVHVFKLRLEVNDAQFRTLRLECRRQQTVLH